MKAAKHLAYLPNIGGTIAVLSGIILILVIRLLGGIRLRRTIVCIHDYQASPLVIWNVVHLPAHMLSKRYGWSGWSGASQI